MDNVITALTSNGMDCSKLLDRSRTGNNYMLTVQYFDQKIAHMSMDDFSSRYRCGEVIRPITRHCNPVADIKEINTPTEVDHYQIRRVIDVYVMPSTEALQRAWIAL